MKKITILTAILVTLFSACSNKTITTAQSPFDRLSSNLVSDWIGVQLRLIKNTTGVTHVAFSRHFSYTGVAVYESLVYGDHKKRSIATLLNGTANLPKPVNGNHLYYPISANAAFAAMFRFFYAGKDINFQIIDSLETAYQYTYSGTLSKNYDVFASIQYGKAVAAAVIEWSKQDNSSNASKPYTPLGEGYWEPTPPAFAPANVPGWGDNRTILAGSTANTTPAAPPAFSKTAGSPFYTMAKEVYDVSQTLTEEQKAIANFWDDAPNGKYVSAFGHWFSILKQLLEQEKLPLMQAVDAYMRLGITMNESAISCWKSKYTFHQVRPVTYLQKYLGYTTWAPLITTPPHPEYLAAHATLSSSAAVALESVFGSNYAFADHTYEALGMGVRNFSSIEAAGTEAGLSRLFGGIHYRPSIEAGKLTGIKVGENVIALLQNGN